MGIITKEVEIKPSGKNIKYYKSLGYDAKYHEPLTVKISDLQSGSSAIIQSLCDYCNEEILTMTYNSYTKRTKETHKIACKNCYPQKIKEVSLLRYGVSNYAMTKECHEKMRNTTESRYGVSHYSQTQDYKERFHNTCVERYGEYYGKQFAEKAFKSFHNKTGYDYPSQSPEVREKIVQSCIEHYDTDNVGKLPEVREKMTKTLYANSSQKTSKQQRYINNLYQGILNYPIKYYNVDIYLPDDNLIIEYDGGFHLGNVITGRLTQEEFNQKEIIRNNIIKREGYKQMRIISTADKLPQDQTLLQMLSYARDYFSKYPQHSWINYDISKSLMFNAENRQGVKYNYGELRTIKDTDLQNTTNATPITAQVV